MKILTTLNSLSQYYAYASFEELATGVCVIIALYPDDIL